MDEAPAWFQVYAATQATAQAAAAQAAAQAATQAATQAAAQADLQAARHLEFMNALFNCNVVSYNRTSSRDTDNIQPLRGVDGEIPDMFPATRGDLFALPANTCDALLVAYELPNGGNLNARRRRLAGHCGISPMQ